MELRPHHLLCTQAYVGKGYSPEFVEHMDQVIAQLSADNSMKIRLTFSSDVLCSHCPHLLEGERCRTEEKVSLLDHKTAEYFHLEEKEYIYQELVKRIKRKLTPKILEDICGCCNWYVSGICRDRFFETEDINFAS